MLLSLVAALLVASAEPKPVFLRLESELASARLVAVARLLEVEPAEWMGRDGRKGSVRLRVTSDPSLVFVGRESLGGELDVAPAATGPSLATAELGRRVGQSVLVVVRDDGSLVLCGHAEGGTEGQAWELHGWCDYNAVFVHSDIEGLGEGRGDSTGFGNYHERWAVDARALDAHLVVRRRARFERVRRLVSGEPAELGPDAFRAHLAALSSEDEGRRTEAEDGLVERAYVRVAALESAVEEAEGVGREALERVLGRLGAWREALRVLRGLAGSADEPRTAALAALVAEVDPDADGKRVRELDAAIAAWSRRDRAASDR